MNKTFLNITGKIFLSDRYEHLFPLHLLQVIDLPYQQNTFLVERKDVFNASVHNINSEGSRNFTHVFTFRRKKKCEIRKLEMYSLLENV